MKEFINIYEKISGNSRNAEYCLGLEAVKGMIDRWDDAVGEIEDRGGDIDEAGTCYVFAVAESKQVIGVWDHDGKMSDWRDGSDWLF